MSTCPDKDIHSIYIDNELPPEFIPEYEAHVKGCPECTAVLNRLRKLKHCFTEDKNTISLDQVYLDQSFERLQQRMKFNAVVSESREEPNKIVPVMVRWSTSAAAAAAVFAMIFIPLHNKTVSSMTLPEVSAISRSTIETLPQNDVIIDGNISQAKVTSVFSEYNQKTVNGSIPVANEQNYSGSFSFNDVDFFRPDFSGRPPHNRFGPPPPKPDEKMMNEHSEMILSRQEESGTVN